MAAALCSANEAAPREEVIPWDDAFQTSYSSEATKMVRSAARTRGFIKVLDDVMDDALRAELVDLATRDVRALFVERCPELHLDLFDPAICDGVAVWCLASDAGNSVEYHVDYAELHRYETNEIVPPLYAATMHIADLESNAQDPKRRIVGGAFVANTGGLKHYGRCGYKGRLLESTAATDFDGEGWIRVPYRGNRGIVHDGEWPHASERVAALADGRKRIILGFNVFGPRVAAICARAPEHSDAFNATVKLYQAAGTALGSSSQKSRMTLETVRANKPLARLLVGLARRRGQTTDATPLHAGEAVAALWKTGARWWPAKIHAANADGTFQVHFDDGMRWLAVPRASIRRTQADVIPAPDNKTATLQ